MRGKLVKPQTKCFQVICRPHICMCTQLFMSAIIRVHKQQVAIHDGSLNLPASSCKQLWRWMCLIGSNLNSVTYKQIDNRYHHHNVHFISSSFKTSFNTLWAAVSIYCSLYCILYTYYIYYGETNVWWIEGVSQWNGQETALDISMTSLKLFYRW